MDNYTPNPFITQPIYDPTRPFATPSVITPTTLTFLLREREAWVAVRAVN